MSQTVAAENTCYHYLLSVLMVTVITIVAATLSVSLLTILLLVSLLVLLLAKHVLVELGTTEVHVLAIACLPG